MEREYIESNKQMKGEYEGNLKKLEETNSKSQKELL